MCKAPADAFFYFFVTRGAGEARRDLLWLRRATRRARHSLRLSTESLPLCDVDSWSCSLRIWDAAFRLLQRAVEVRRRSSTVPLLSILSVSVRSD